MWGFCVTLKNLRRGGYICFTIVVYAAGEGNHIWFWHEPWSGPISLKELYLKLFAYAVVQKALISDMVIFAPNEGGRDFLFRRNFNE